MKSIDEANRTRSVVVTAIAVVAMTGGCARAVLPARGPDAAVAVDCRVATSAFREEPFVERLVLMSTTERRACLGQLAEDIQTPRGMNSAWAIEALARRGFVEDTAVLRPLIDCASEQLDSRAGYCNRALVALTRHPYGESFFAREARAAAYTVDNRNQIVAVWREFARRFEKGHPIFDPFLAEICAKTIRGAGTRLSEALSTFIPNHVALGYLRNLSPDPAVLLKTQGEAERIFSFGLGEKFGLPGNWISGGPLKGFRILVFRPGVAHPALALAPDISIQAFPVEDADYHEAFTALDLEVRFQIVTSNDPLRRAAIDAMKASLQELRNANTRISR